jgi:hypothetical protein
MKAYRDWQRLRQQHHSTDAVGEGIALSVSCRWKAPFVLGYTREEGAVDEPAEMSVSKTGFQDVEPPSCSTRTQRNVLQPPTPG